MRICAYAYNKTYNKFYYIMPYLKCVLLFIDRFEISADKNREAIPFKEVTTGAKDGIYLHFRDLCSNKI